MNPPALRLLPFAVLAATTLTLTPADAQVWIDMDESEDYVARHEASFVQAGDKFYLFGGREQARRLDIYDYTTDTWTSSGRGEFAPQEFNHFQATEYQGLIWVIGAFRTNSFPNEAPADSVYVYDPALASWMRGPEIPSGRRRGGAGLAIHDDKFYVVAGNTIGHNGGYISWFDEYDPQTGEWKPLEDAPRPRDHFHAGVVDGKLYAVGGRLSGGTDGVFAPTIPEVDVFDFATDTWSTLPPESNLPTPRAAPAVAVFDGKIMVIGGETITPLDQAYDTVEALDPSTNTWETLASLNHAHHGTQAISSGEGVYIAVGSPNRGGGNQHNMEVYNKDAPAGSPSVAGELSAPADALVVAGKAKLVPLEHVDGNVGAFVTDVAINGESAADFLVTTPGGDNPFLIPIGGARDLVVEYTGADEGVSVTLDVTYNGKQTVSVAVTGSLVPEPASIALSIAAVLSAIALMRRRI